MDPDICICQELKYSCMDFTVSIFLMIKITEIRNKVE